MLYHLRKGRGDRDSSVIVYKELTLALFVNWEDKSLLERTRNFTSFKDMVGGVVLAARLHT